MRIFHKEGWQSFWPNFLAVILGIAITFGGERIISDYIDQHMARQVVRKVKQNVEKKLRLSQEQMKESLGDFECLDRVYEARKNGEMESVSTDTLMRFVDFFVSRSFVTYEKSIQDLVASSECLKIIQDAEVVDCVSEICSLLSARMENTVKMYDELNRIARRLRERIPITIEQSDMPERQYYEMVASTLFNDSYCWFSIFDDSLVGYLDVEQMCMEELQKQVDRLAAAGY